MPNWISLGLFWIPFGFLSHVHLLRQLILEASQSRGPCGPEFILYAR